ncbi:MAG TPA: hypothetical protein DCM73_01435 [Clostridiales bacterium]|nr:hypothetical protein [Clostridiales bacterium]
MKHLFLSGDIKVGKSTIIDYLIRNLKINKEQLGGFYTNAYVENNKVKGFYIEPVNYDLEIPEIQERLIGFTPDGQRWLGVKSTFNNFGTQILDSCMKNQYRLIVMDELGFFENDAVCFQNKVHEVLSGNNRVIGCIKPVSTPFMDSIRKRKDVTEVRITKSNRDTIPLILAEKFEL